MIADSTRQTPSSDSSLNESTSPGRTAENGRSALRSSSPETKFFVDPNEPRNDEVDLARIESAVKSILIAVGEDPSRDGLLETPARVARMYAEMFAGLKSDPGRHLAKVFDEDYDEIVLVRDISFCSMCEHHLLPFTGARPHRLPAEWQSGRFEQAGTRRGGSRATSAGPRANDPDHRRFD